MHIYQRLKELRMEKGLSQKDVAEILGSVQPQYFKYETGAQELPMHHFITLEDFYGVSLDYLAGRSDVR